MKKTGFKATVASGIEAANSTGGQIMPPVMGAAAFIMAQLLGSLMPISWWRQPSRPSFTTLALYFMIDFLALRDGIKAIPKEDMPDVEKGVQRTGSPPHSAGRHCLGHHGGVYHLYLRPLGHGSRCDHEHVPQGHADGHQGNIECNGFRSQRGCGHSHPCAVAGIIVGMVVHTGLGLNLPAWSSSWAKIPCSSSFF